jgi:thiamine transporter ThiT
MSAATREQPRDRRGYAMVVLSYLLMGAIAALVDYTSAPEAVVLCLRMAFASLALAALFARRGMLADRRPPAPPPGSCSWALVRR